MVSNRIHCSKQRCPTPEDLKSSPPSRELQPLVHLTQQHPAAWRCDRTLGSPEINKSWFPKTTADKQNASVMEHWKSLPPSAEPCFLLNSFDHSLLFLRILKMFFLIPEDFENDFINHSILVPVHTIPCLKTMHWHGAFVFKQASTLVPRRHKPVRVFSIPIKEYSQSPQLCRYSRVLDHLSLRILSQFSWDRCCAVSERFSPGCKQLTTMQCYL